MIGSRIESRPSLPWWAILIFTTGVCMLVGGVAYGQTRLSIESLLPLSVGLSLIFLVREKKLVAEFAEGSIEIENPPASIAYAGLKDVRIGGIPHDPVKFRKKRSPIHVEHEAGVLHFPRRLNVDSHEVYRFLAEQIPLSGDRDVNPNLAEYLERQESYHGPDQIWTYRASARNRRTGRLRGFRAFCSGLILAGFLWISIGFGTQIDPETNWGGFGILCGATGVALFLISLANQDLSNRFVKNWKKASIVISPQGMAMVQGEIQGEIRWPELLDVKLRAKPARLSFQYSQGLSGIILKVKGADILIADIYDRPIYVIHKRILHASGRASVEEIDL
jgi:hypothetical protein